LAKKKKIEKAPREMTHRQLSHHKKAQRRQRIILFSGISIIVAVVLIILGGWFAGEYLPLHKTIIQVYDTKFNTAYFIDMLKIYGKSQGSGMLASMVSSITNDIIQTELIRQAAETLGISVSDEEAKKLLENAGIPVSDAGMAIARAQLLPDKLKSGYFTSLVPESDNQVYMKAMMIESDTLAKVVRERIANGENFTMLNEKYATNYTSKTNQGDYGWHPASILKDLVGSTLPLDFAFSADVKAGDLSSPLSDNASYKQLGYWLIRINERPTVDSANVSAILLSSEEEALIIKARLEAGEELAPIADNRSQYSPSKEKHGELGMITTSENITDAYNGYVFNPSTEVGKWSQPVREDTLWTQGGAWLVQIVDKEENRKLSDDDRNTLIEQAYTDWGSALSTAGSNYVINDITAEIQQWAIDRATKELQ
jgi:parvulin-like peptidyl-prolyl isomerase